jgi:hypothetical protein
MSQFYGLPIRVKRTPDGKPKSFLWLVSSLQPDSRERLQGGNLRIPCGSQTQLG